MLYTIKKLQRNTEFMIPKAPFRRLVREIAREVSEEEFNWQPTAM
jgi:histone H3/H4